MATKISELPAGVSPVSTAQIEVNEGGTSKRYTLAQAQAANFDATPPAAVGTAAAGSAATAARRDHVHAATGAGVTSVLTNFGKFLLTSAETTIQAVIEYFDKNMVTDLEVYIPATSMGAYDADGLAAAQQLGGAGDLTLNGALISAGAWSSGHANVYRGITMYCAGDMSGVKFKVHYTNVLGVATDSGWVSGANAGSKTMLSSAIGVSRIEADAAVGTDVTFGVGIPLVGVGPQFGKHFQIDEGASDWWLVARNWLNKLDTAALTTGRDGVCSISVLKDATPRTITFSNAGGLTVKPMGAAMASGSASKYIDYALRINARKDVAFFYNSGAEV